MGTSSGVHRRLVFFGFPSVTHVDLGGFIF
jgi:hypothetical protein